jgi:hypothetical protein
MAGFLSWLMKPTYVSMGTGILQLPSLVLDIDSVEDVVNIIEKRRIETVDGLEILGARHADLWPELAQKLELAERPTLITLQPANYVAGKAPRETEISKLEGLPAGERERIQITGWVDVTLRRGAPAGVWSNSADPSVVTEVADFLLRVGTLRIEYKKMLQFVPFVLLAALLACAIWLVLTIATPLPLIATGAVLLIFACAGSWYWSKSLRAKFSSFAGVRFREVSRASTRERLGDTKANIIVFGITTLIIGPLGVFIGGLLFGGK